MIGNIVVFIPFGYFISRYIGAKRIWQITLITLITSVTIEIVQYNIGRAMDIDDIILNVIGGIFGFLVYRLLSIIWHKLPNFMQKDYIYNLICGALILIGIIWFVHALGWF